MFKGPESRLTVVTIVKSLLGSRTLPCPREASAAYGPRTESTQSAPALFETELITARSRLYYFVKVEWY